MSASVGHIVVARKATKVVAVSVVDSQGVFLSNSVMVLMSILVADLLIESRRTKLNLLFN